MIRTAHKKPWISSIARLCHITSSLVLHPIIFEIAARAIVRRREMLESGSLQPVEGGRSTSLMPQMSQRSRDRCHGGPAAGRKQSSSLSSRAYLLLCPFYFLHSDFSPCIHRSHSDLYVQFPHSSATPFIPARYHRAFHIPDRTLKPDLLWPCPDDGLYHGGHAERCAGRAGDEQAGLAVAEGRHAGRDEAVIRRTSTPRA